MRLRECVVTYRRVEHPEVTTRKIACSTDIATMFAAQRDLIVESFWAVMLDCRSNVIGYHESARGKIDSVGVLAADVFRPAIVVGAKAIVVVHNHPTGDPQPSIADAETTLKLVEAGEILGIKVVDHIVIAAEGHYSFLDAGLMPASKPMEVS